CKCEEQQQGNLPPAGGDSMLGKTREFRCRAGRLAEGKQGGRRQTRGQTCGGIGGREQHRQQPRGQGHPSTQQSLVQTPAGLAETGLDGAARPTELTRRFLVGLALPVTEENRQPKVFGQSGELVFQESAEFSPGRFLSRVSGGNRLPRLS